MTVMLGCSLVAQPLFVFADAKLIGLFLVHLLVCFLLVFICCHLSLSQKLESKKEEFRKYLERSGTIEALTKGE
jgi:hypothetical protein